MKSVVCLDNYGKTPETNLVAAHLKSRPAIDGQVVHEGQGADCGEYREAAGAIGLLVKGARAGSGYPRSFPTDFEP
jgi:hypothetical protein